MSHSLASRYDVDVNVKNLDQTQVDRKIEVMLHRTKALKASSLPRVTSYANYLRPKVGRRERCRIRRERYRIRRIRELQTLSDEKCNMLLVVATLLLTVSYQGIHSPPGGLWQDDYNPAPGTNESNTIAPNGKITTTPHSHKAGTVIGSIQLFMVLNSTSLIYAFIHDYFSAHSIWVR